MLSFISDLRRRRPLSTYPPGRTSSPQAPVYLVFQPIRFTPAGITDGGVSSYLAFSPLPAEAGGIVSVALSVTLARAFPLGSMVLCVDRTFLSLAAATSRFSFFAFTIVETRKGTSLHYFNVCRDPKYCVSTRSFTY